MINVGEYISSEEIVPEDIKVEWDMWLNAQRDPGHYDSFKRYNQITKSMYWVTEIYMPAHLFERLEKSREAQPEKESLENKS